MKIVLRHKYLDLASKVQWSSKKDLIVNRIVEYDIRSANTTMLLRSEKLSADDVAMLNSLPKHEREVAVGKMIAIRPEIHRIIADGIARAKLILFTENHITEDDVQSIRNDAIFIVGRRLKATSFGPVEFRVKNVYDVFFRLEGGLDIYHGEDGHIDIKGISDDILDNDDHREGMLLFLERCSEHLCSGRRDRLRRYLIDFSVAYKRRELPACFYRELSKANGYRLGNVEDAVELILDKVGDDDIERLNIAYNYNRIVIPMIRRFI